MDMKGIMGEKWLRYKVCWGLGKWDSGAVECEIEVLYDILALGVLEKMKIHPLIAMPAKVQKAGFNILPYFVQCRPATLFYTHCTIVHSCIIHSVIVRFIVLLFSCVTCHIA